MSRVDLIRPLLPAREWARVESYILRDCGHGTDVFGTSLEGFGAAYAIAYWLHRYYFRVVSAGHDNIPRRGGAVVVGNHSGVLPFDAMMLAADVFRHKEPPRLVRYMVDYFVYRIPWLGTWFRSLGQIPGTRRNFDGLIEQGHLVGIFPEGAPALGKPASARYQLFPFSHGHVELAARHGVPVIPFGLVGAEEQQTMLTDLKPLARALRLPYIPVTTTFPWLGPAGLLPKPVRYYLHYGAPIEVDPDVLQSVEVRGREVDRVRDAVADQNPFRPGGARARPGGRRVIEGHQPGAPREGRRRIMVTGAHRKVAIELVGRLLDDPNVELILAVSHGACPNELLGHDPERFHYTAADLSRRRQVDNLFLLESFRERPLDTVVHLAFQGNPVGYDFRRHEFNVKSTQHLLEGSLSHSVGKYVFLSSDTVYKIGPRNDYMVREDAELNLDPDAHPIVRDTIDAEFLCRAKMDDPRCDVMVIRPSGVLGGGVMSGINLLFESQPPLLPVGFDPMINPTTKARLARDLHVALSLYGKGVYNVSGPAAGPLSRFLEEAGARPLRVPGPVLRAASRAQRLAGRSRYRAGFHPKRLYYSLVLDDGRFQRLFRSQAELVDPRPASEPRTQPPSSPKTPS